MKVNIINKLHQSTSRDYEGRMTDEKVRCMKVARKFGKEFFDGPRRFGYGGYRYDGRFKISYCKQNRKLNQHCLTKQAATIGPISSIVHGVIEVEIAQIVRVNQRIPVVVQCDQIQRYGQRRRERDQVLVFPHRNSVLYTTVFLQKNSQAAPIGPIVNGRVVIYPVQAHQAHQTDGQQDRSLHRLPPDA